MPTPIDPKRLPGLKQALEGYGPEDRAAQAQLAEVYGVSNARLSTLIKSRFPDFPPAERHDDKTHWYPARAAIASMIAYMEGTSEKKVAQARRHSAVLGRVTEAKAAAGDDTDEAPPLSAADLDRLASAQTKMFRLKQMQGEYVEAAKVREIARAVHTMVTREVMNMVYVLDPNGKLSTGDRDRLQTRCRAMVVKIHDQLGGFLEGLSDVERVEGGRAGTDQPEPGRRADRRRRPVAQPA